MRSALFACLLAAVSFSMNGQALISSELIGFTTEAQLEAQFGLDFRSDVTRYKITYTTTGVMGQPDTATGLLVVPSTRIDEKLAVVAYQHGTTNGPSDAPSRGGAGTRESLAYGGMGYYVTAADFLGLGDHPGFHPYVHADTEASAGRDLLFAAKEFIADDTGETEFDHLFVSGYSQGGHAAMALMQDLEENWSEDFQMTAAAPMSGPYSISGVMYDRMLGDEPYFFVSYPIYAIVGLQEVYGNLYASVDEVFRAPYLPAIDAFYNREIDLTQLTAFVFATLVANVGSPITRELLVPEYIEAIEADEDHPLRVALRDNDTFNWKTQTPTRIIYCTADDQVPFLNSIVADSALNANGSADVTKIDIDPDADHGECAEPAIEESVRFFDSFVLTSSTQDISLEKNEFAYPNPTSGHLNLNLPTSNAYALALRDMSGRLVMEVQRGGRSSLDVSGIPSGIYILSAQSDRSAFIQKIIVK